VFVVAFRRRADFDPARGSLRAWLYGIALNLSRTQRRSDRRGAAANRRMFLRELGSSESEAVEDAIVASEQAQAVSHAFAQLSYMERQVIALYAWEELSYDEIANVLDVPIGTVRSRLARARAHLRELITPFGQEAHDG
jgi:RNA polymerase sigma-70 factor (ECF subfamily)